VVTPDGNTEPGVCDFVQTRLPEAVQLSVAVGSVHDTTDVQTPGPLVLTILLKQPLITGFWVSFTVTVKLQVAVLAGVAPSETVQLMVVVPTLNVRVPNCPLPLPVVAPVMVQAKVAPAQLSPNVIDGTATLALQALLSLLTVKLSGQVIVGTWLSVTVTVKLHCAVRDAASVTV
jgi:hypothetical protein